jgi:hypothetical protein
MTVPDFDIYKGLTILLFGSTGSGKTPMIGELAEWVYKNWGLHTRLASCDEGGWRSINPHVKLGLVQPHALAGDPWIWLDNMVRGKLYDEKTKKWTSSIDPKVGVWAFEGVTSTTDHLMSWMADASAKGVNIGGGGAFNFKAGDDKNKINIGSNNKAHYGVAQQQVYEKILLSQQLPGIVIWTAGDSRTDDDAVGQVVGPQSAGRKQTGELPRHFELTFNIVAEVSLGTELPKHVLYLVQHSEPTAGGAKTLTNARVPLDGGDVVPIPQKIEPASIVQAMELLGRREEAATDALRRRLGM